MKRNKILRVQIVLMAIISILLLIYGVWFLARHPRFSCDLNMRYYEIACAHEGIDSFDIFERKISSDRFFGHPRPDKPDEEEGDRKDVHAYPAWHTAVFWWYGFVSEKACFAIMLGMYLCSCVWIGIWAVKRIQFFDMEHYIAGILFLLVIMEYSINYVFFSMNYGLLLLGCSCLLYAVLEKKNEILASIAFSLIMTKPQIGILFLIPLIINRNYKTVIIAGLLCIIETLFTAWKLDKSPIELILQIPKIGAPYYKGYIGQAFIDLFGPFGLYIPMAAFASLATAGCFLLRNAKDVWVRFLPAIAFTPFWTYSQNHDWVIVLPCCIYIINNIQKWPRLCSICFWLAILRAVALLAYEHSYYSIGKLGLSTLFFLTIVSLSCLMAILNENEKWDYRSVMRKMIFMGRDDG